MGRDRKYCFLFVSAPFSGIEVHLRNLKEIISQREEIDAEWIFVEWEPEELLTRVPPLSLNWTLKGGYVVRSRLRALERAGHKFDAALFNNVVLPVFLPGFRKRVPFLMCLDVTPRLIEGFEKWYFNNVIPYRSVGRGLKERFLTRCVYNDASDIITWSNLVRDSLVSHYQVPEQTIEVIPPGVNLTYWSPSGIAKSNRRTQILFVGADFNRKGGDVLLAASTKPEFKDCDFHFVTKNFSAPPTPNVFVYPNIDPNSDDLRNLYRNADIFALPTRADFSPNVICEAMGCELPVVATRVGAINEMVSDGVNGYLIDVGDQNGLERSLAELVADPDKRRSMGKNGRELALKYFDMEQNALRVLQKMKDVSDRNQTS